MSSNSQPREIELAKKLERLKDELNRIDTVCKKTNRANNLMLWEWDARCAHFYHSGFGEYYNALTIPDEIAKKYLEIIKQETIEYRRREWDRVMNELRIEIEKGCADFCDGAK